MDFEDEKLLDAAQFVLWKREGALHRASALVRSVSFETFVQTEEKRVKDQGRGRRL